MDDDIGFEPYRPQPKTRELISATRKILEKEHPATIRYCFYRLAARNLIPNLKKKYKGYIKVMVRARKARMVPFEWVEDTSRRCLKVPLFDSPIGFLEEKIETYYKNTWKNQLCFMVILLEKEALTGIVWDVASYFNVPVFPTRGYSSWSIFHKDLREEVHKRFGKPLIALVIGDYDPSGMDIPNDHINKLNFFNVHPDVYERIALTREQVAKYELPPQMAKKTDPRYKKFSAQHGLLSVEVDALSPSVLKQLVKTAIVKYLDLDQFRKDLKAEEREKQKLRNFLKSFKEAMEESMGADG